MADQKQGNQDDPNVSRADDDQIRGRAEDEVDEFDEDSDELDEEDEAEDEERGSF